ncbi:MAG: hypothetical protein AAB654_19020 [Acidobacteriota bacterium]
MRKPAYQQARFDATGEVNLENPVAVEMAIISILDRLYGDDYDPALLRQGIDVLVRSFQGRNPGILRCDTLYHDLRHALETGLTMARLLDAHAGSLPAGSADGIDARHALLGVLLALFHDFGLLRRESEAQTLGAAFTPVHEERGVEFMRRHLAGTSLGSLAGRAELIMPTKLNFKIPESWSAPDRRLANMVASADLISQLSDCCYLEKCWSFLFVEFSAFGVAGTPDSIYPDRETLMIKTYEFYSSLVVPRLEQELCGVHHLLDAYYSDNDPYQKSIQRNLSYLDAVLTLQDFTRLRRRPRPYIGDPTAE